MPALMRHAYHELRRLAGITGCSRWSAHGTTACRREALRTLKEMNADRFDFN
jgi:hypothetical protein